MSDVLPNPSPPAQGDLRGVLAIPAFARLWRAMAFGSLGDWLGLLACTALAKQLAGDDYAKANVAIAGVFIVRLLPAVLIGPFAGVIVDRFDRRRLMYTCDILRAGLFISIPLVREFGGCTQQPYLSRPSHFFGVLQKRQPFPTWCHAIDWKRQIK